MTIKRPKNPGNASGCHIYKYIFVIQFSIAYVKRFWNVTKFNSEDSKFKTWQRHNYLTCDNISESKYYSTDRSSFIYNYSFQNQ